MIEQLKPNTVHVDFIAPAPNRNTYKVEGYYASAKPVAEGALRIRTASGLIRTKVVRRDDIKSEAGLHYYGFEAEVRLLERDKLSFVTEGSPGALKIHTGQFTHLSPLTLAYRHIRKSRALMQKFPRQIHYRKASYLRQATYEVLFCLRLLLHWRVDNVKAALKGILRPTRKRSTKEVLFEAAKPILIVGESLVKLPQAYALRVATLYRTSQQSLPIWIISDRGMSAGDNGEALYRYIRLYEKPQAEVYFVLSKKSRDYDSLKKLAGKYLLDQDSLRYKLKFLCAEKIISSHADIEVTNPFLRQRYHYQDLMQHQFVFLQHGVIRHDHSGWLNRYQKNIKMFVTSAQREHDSILTYNYGYTDKEVVLTGLPRFDYLDSESKGKVILAPTYRRELARLPTNKNGARPYDPKFKESAYYHTYNSLLNDKRLLDVLQHNNMVLELYLHPNLHAQASDFKQTDKVQIRQYPYNYREAFRDGNILITDYSSVSFDFAYLKKPLIYYQYDRDTYFDHSLSESADFFSDEQDGFGPVITEHKKLIDEVTSLINAKAMPSEYRKKVDSFFYKIDQRNSQRVYQAITEIDDTV